MGNGHKKYGSYDYQLGSRQPPYVKGACYNVEMTQNGRGSVGPIMGQERRSYDEHQLASHLSPPKMGQGQNAIIKQQYANAAGMAPRPEMFMATPQSNY